MIRSFSFLGGAGVDTFFSMLARFWFNFEVWGEGNSFGAGSLFFFILRD